MQPSIQLVRKNKSRTFPVLVSYLYGGRFKWLASSGTRLSRFQYSNDNFYIHLCVLRATLHHTHSFHLHNTNKLEEDFKKFMCFRHSADADCNQIWLHLNGNFLRSRFCLPIQDFHLYFSIQYIYIFLLSSH